MRNVIKVNFPFVLSGFGRKGAKCELKMWIQWSMKRFNQMQCLVFVHSLMNELKWRSKERKEANICINTQTIDRSTIKSLKMLVEFIHCRCWNAFLAKSYRKVGSFGSVCVYQGCGHFWKVSEIESFPKALKEVSSLCLSNAL